MQFTASDKCIETYWQLKAKSLDLLDQGLNPLRRSNRAFSKSPDIPLRAATLGGSGSSQSKVPSSFIQLRKSGGEVR